MHASTGMTMCIGCSSSRFCWQLALLLCTLASILTAVDGAEEDNNLVIINSTDGFVYRDNAFRKTRQSFYASGMRDATTGVLEVRLGGEDDSTRRRMSGGWVHTFAVTGEEDLPLTLSLEFNLAQSSEYEPDEFSQALVSLDGTLIGQSPFKYLAHINGDENGGSVRTTGWKKFQVHLNLNGAAVAGGTGDHTLILGGYNNRKTRSTEFTTIQFRNVVLSVSAPQPQQPPHDPGAHPQTVVGRLNMDTFKSNVKALSDLGDRKQGSSSYISAAKWVKSKLLSFGYESVEYHSYSYFGSPRRNMYVTKVGTKFPDRMFLVSAHLDGRGGGGAANDDGSGCALVLELARVLASEDVSLEISVRMVFWNNEETGLDGSSYYARDRAGLQGVEDPDGSGKYPEPTWLGIVTHDQILFDHGLPAESNQSPNADADIEYQASSHYAANSEALAHAFLFLGDTYATQYPAEVSGDMCCTDSVPFQDLIPSVSIRENRRAAEIGRGAAPHWHQTSDLFATYNEDDFLFGFNIVQRTVGTIGQLTGLKVN